jgi:hypothetical protein
MVVIGDCTLGRTPACPSSKRHKQRLSIHRSTVTRRQMKLNFRTITAPLYGNETGISRVLESDHHSSLQTNKKISICYI